jgi:heptosyltransferase III
MKPDASTHRLLLDRTTYDGLRRILVGWLLRRTYRAIDATIRRNGELAGARIQRILVCRPNHRLGNTLLMTPLIVELGRIFPEAKVDVIAGGVAGPDVFRNIHNVERVICLPRHMAKHPIYVVRMALQLRRERYDLAIDPCEASQSGRLLLAVARAKHAIGISTFESRHDPNWLAVMQKGPSHVAQLPVFLLRNALSPAGFETEVDYPAMTLDLSMPERQAAQARLDAMTHVGIRERPKATIGIFAAATGTKRYDSAWWLRFIAEMRVQRADYAIVELASEHGQSHLRRELPSFSSASIREVAAFISNMTCFVSADCGVMHLASASGVTTIGLFSTTDPEKYAPYGQNSQAITTNGKSPEEVARIAVSIVEATISENGNRSDFHGKRMSALARDHSCDAMTDLSTHGSCDAAWTQT